jgi:hypothetical protein
MFHSKRCFAAETYAMIAFVLNNECFHRIADYLAVQKQIITIFKKALLKSNVDFWLI